MVLAVGGGKGFSLEFTRHSFNRIPKFTLAKLKFLDARKYTSEAFRPGAPQELLMAGNPLEAARVSRDWWRIGFRIYVALEMDHAFRTPRALVALSDSDSSETGRLPREEKAYSERHREFGRTRARAPSDTFSKSETSADVVR